MFVKICGLTNLDDALFATAMGANALGFLFAPSERQVSVSAVAEITKRLPDGVLSVGVFRDQHPDQVLETVMKAGLTGAQLHGHEPPRVVRDLRAKLPLVIKAFEAGVPEVARAKEYDADAILLDGRNPGSGVAFDWSLAEAPQGVRVILAGGLNPENVAHAINAVRPWGVDVSTGVEGATKRSKSPQAVRDFIRAARSAATAIRTSQGSSESVSAVKGLRLRPADIEAAESARRAATSRAGVYDWEDA